MKVSAVKQLDYKRKLNFPGAIAQVKQSKLNIKLNIRGSKINFQGAQITELNSLFLKSFEGLKKSKIFSPILKSDSIQEKQNLIYTSSLNAKRVFGKYLHELSHAPDFDNGAITPISKSNLVENLFYKREDLTSIKAYKIRGAFYQMSELLKLHNPENIHFIAASTGNHALGVLKSAEILRAKNVTICVPQTTSRFKIDKLENKILELQKKGINSKLLIEGSSFEDTNELAKVLAKMNSDCYYIDPYNNHKAVAGQGTIALELINQLENLQGTNDLRKISIVVPIGGGGLVSGISSVLKQGIKSSPILNNIEFEVVGVKLADFSSKLGDAIKVSKVGEHNEELISNFVDMHIKVTDAQMQSGIDFLQKDLKQKFEGASAATLVPVLEKKLIADKTHATICVLSGANS